MYLGSIGLNNSYASRLHFFDYEMYFGSIGLHFY